MPHKILVPLFSDVWLQICCLGFLIHEMDKALLGNFAGYRSTQSSANSHLSPELPSLPFCETQLSQKEFLVSFLFVSGAEEETFWSPCDSLETPLPARLLWLALTFYVSFIHGYGVFVVKGTSFPFYFLSVMLPAKIAAQCQLVVRCRAVLSCLQVPVGWLQVERAIFLSTRPSPHRHELSQRVLRLSRHLRP